LGGGTADDWRVSCVDGAVSQFSFERRLLSVFILGQ